MSVEIEINVLCHECDSSLGAYTCISADGEQEIAVHPCEECTEKALEEGGKKAEEDVQSLLETEKENAYEEGYEAGVEEGRAQMSEEY